MRKSLRSAVRGGLSVAIAVASAFAPTDGRAGIMEPYDSQLHRLGGNCKKGQSDHTRIVCGMTHIQRTCSRWFADLLGCNGAVESAARTAAKVCVDATGLGPSSSIAAALNKFNAASSAWTKVPGDRTKRNCGGAVSGAGSKLTSCFQKTGGPSVWVPRLKGHIAALRARIDGFKCPEGTDLKLIEKSKVDAALAEAGRKLKTAEEWFEKKNWYDAAGSSACVAETQLEFAKQLCQERKEMTAEDECVKAQKTRLDRQVRLAHRLERRFGSQQSIWMDIRNCHEEREIIKYRIMPGVTSCVVMATAAAKERDCGKLKAATAKVGACLQPAMDIVAYNDDYITGLNRSTATMKACEKQIMKRVKTELLDEILGSCENFFAAVSRVSCDALFNWTLKSLPTDGAEGMASACLKGALKGVVCAPANLLQFASEIQCAAVEGLLEGECKEWGPLATQCIVGKHMARKIGSAWSCGKALYALSGAVGTAKALAPIAAEFGCDLIAGSVFDAGLGAASKAGRLGPLLRKLHHFLESLPKAAKLPLEVAEKISGLAREAGHACHVEGGGHGGSSHGDKPKTVDTLVRVTTPETEDKTEAPPSPTTQPTQPGTKPGVKPGPKTGPKPEYIPGKVGGAGNACKGFKTGDTGHAKKEGAPVRNAASWDPKSVVGKMSVCEYLKMLRIRQAKGGGAFVEIEVKGETRYMHCLDVAVGKPPCGD